MDIWSNPIPCNHEPSALEGFVFLALQEGCSTSKFRAGDHSGVVVIQHAQLHRPDESQIASQRRANASDGSKAADSVANIGHSGVPRKFVRCRLSQFTNGSRV
jgi:hypothetical protein